MKCNICGGTDFEDYRSRENVKCSSCGSMERMRVMLLALESINAFKPKLEILHIAPDVSVARKLKAVHGSGYLAADFNPKLFPQDLEVTKIDLTKDVFSLPSRKYDLIIHSHVLEHLPCEITPVLFHLHRALKRTGIQVICVPFDEGKTSADFNIMSGREREERFGQRDHMRRFGVDDLNLNLGMVFQLSPFDPTKIYTQKQLEEANIKTDWSGLPTSNTIFLQRKSSTKLCQKSGISGFVERVFS